MEVLVEYIGQPHDTCRARLIDSPSDGRYTGQSITCTNKSEALGVVETYNVFMLLGQGISLEAALERVRAKVTPAATELYLQYLSIL